MPRYFLQIKNRKLSLTVIIKNEDKMIEIYLLHLLLNIIIFLYFVGKTMQRKKNSLDYAFIKATLTGGKKKLQSKKLMKAKMVFWKFFLSNISILLSNETEICTCFITHISFVHAAVITEDCYWNLRMWNEVLDALDSIVMASFWWSEILHGLYSKNSKLAIKRHALKRFYLNFRF